MHWVKRTRYVLCFTVQRIWLSFKVTASLLTNGHRHMACHYPRLTGSSSDIPSTGSFAYCWGSLASVLFVPLTAEWSHGRPLAPSKVRAASRNVRKLSVGSSGSNMVSNRPKHLAHGRCQPYDQTPGFGGGHSLTDPLSHVNSPRSCNGDTFNTDLHRQTSSVALYIPSHVFSRSFFPLAVFSYHIKTGIPFIGHDPP